MDVADVEQLFTRADGSFVFARWGRGIAPVVFGVEDETLGVIKGAIDAVCRLAGHEMTDGDAELGSNFMWFFFRDWDELLEVPRLGDMVPMRFPGCPSVRPSGRPAVRLSGRSPVQLSCLAS